MIDVRLRLFAAVTLCVLAVGCGSKNPNAPARVSGQVLYKGSPVPGGAIAFHTEQKTVYATRLDDNGAYEVLDVPAGPLTVTVETESANPSKKVAAYGGDKGAKGYAERLAKEGKAAQGKSNSGKYRKIPAKYADPKTSRLSVTLDTGSNKQNFELTD